jgi:exodeoxyribonuclease VII large subunit
MDDFSTARPRTPLSVTALNEQVRMLLTGLPAVRVQGEVSRVTQSGGHIYFDLKDSGSRIAVKVWRTVVGRLRLQPREGQQVVVSGRVEAWVAGGSYALICSDLEVAGQGDLWLALQRLKEQLHREGLFDPARKRPLPFLPRRVALVTSPTGAAIRDMLRVLGDRFPLQILVVPAKVQGEGAAESVAQGIELVNRLDAADVIIAGRGGGSIEDLWAFNEERLVRAVAASRIPLVSAVGHEIDTLLSDLAADVRAPTPTAAAELVVPRKTDLDAAIANLRQRLQQASLRAVQAERRHLRQVEARLGDGGGITGLRQLRLDDLQQRLGRSSERLCAVQRRRLEALARRLQAAHPLRRLGQQRRDLAVLQTRIAQAGQATVRRRRDRLGRQSAVLEALSPLAALGRGYGIIRRAGGLPLAQAAGVAGGDAIEVLLRDGALDCRVETVRLRASPSASLQDRET